jgi:predicted nucleic acid-binding protein
MQYVLDTSVMLHWFNSSNDADTALALLLREEHLNESVQIQVLDQSIYELMHVLRENPRFDQDSITSALDSLEYMHIGVVPYSHELARHSAQIATEHEISIYASCFVALGTHLRCQAITSDERLYEKVASNPWTILLANLVF